MHWNLIDYDLTETLMCTHDINVDDEVNLITASDSVNHIAPSRRSSVPNMRNAELVPMPFPLSCNEHTCSVSNHKHQKRAQSLEKKHSKELK